MIGNYAQLRPTALLACTNPDCEHVITPSDFVDVDEWKLQDGIVVIRDDVL
ncbi:hypothetical protein [Streptomyces sp. H27-H5]|uniref:hypothetical protein n=1 Tax=Streptomyces sp. H27-H5 TaxID=2996460 RepID=UPI002271A543|nr:hypothetical protein [Streptomyces sp. H27-H5]MCY0961793.1 hypothetical protein [Streptomyces sp. H27-H5]